MLKRLSLAFVAAMLGGCVLESDTPLIPEEQAELLLGSQPVQFAMYEMRDGNWHKEEGSFTFTPEGNHYRATDGKSETMFSFKTTVNKRWAVQGSEGGKSVSYVIAEQVGTEIFLLPLDCKSLHEAKTFEALVDFVGDDCTVKPGADAGAVFAAAAQLPFPHEMKMVRQ